MNKQEGRIRIPSGCAISAIIFRDGKRMTGEKIIESMRPMHDRSNGLGGGFAAYGIYPEYKDFFALHMFLEDRAARKSCEAFCGRPWRSSTWSASPSARRRPSPMSR